MPSLTLRVGVSGHRPNRLGGSDPMLLDAQIRRVLEAIVQAAHSCAQSVPQAQPIRCRLLSSLAEGADRLVAEAALSAGCALQVPLPFPQADYETDFETESSKQAFRALLARADSVFELDVAGEERARGYRAAGNIVLEQSDLLLVIWDGMPANGIGGTVEIMEEANAVGLPVLCIGARAPHVISFQNEEDPLSHLASVIRQLLVPSAAVQSAARSYQQEAWPRRYASTSYAFVRLLSEHCWKTPGRPDFVDSGAAIECASLRPYFQWADTLATNYGERSRSAALRIQILASLSVFFGLISIAFDDHAAVLRVLSILELTSTLLVVVDALLLTRRPWHARWLLYRAIAEQIRTLDFLAPIAQSPTTHATEEQDGTAQFAASFLGQIVRELGLLPAKVSSSFLHTRTARLRDVVEQQAAFQAATSRRYGALEETLHRGGLTLFIAAVGLSFYDVAKSFRLTDFASPWTTTISALLPALGAALSSIATQGEYKRLADRAKGMHRTLTALGSRLTRTEPATLGALAAISQEAADVLTSEVRDWQVLVSTRKPSLPT